MDIFAKLREPFAEHEIKWRKGAGGMQLAYVDARAIMDRLDAVVGPANWQTAYQQSGGITFCGIGIREEAMFEEVDDADRWVWKWDGAGESQIEAEKGACSDSFRRAFYRWGCRYLYSLPKNAGPGRMPDWALPGGTGIPPTRMSGSTTVPRDVLEQAEASAAAVAAAVEAADERPLEAEELEVVIKNAQSNADLDVATREVKRSLAAGIVSDEERTNLTKLWQARKKSV